MKKKFKYVLFVLSIAIIGTMSLSAASQQVFSANVLIDPNNAFSSRTNVAYYPNAVVTVTPLALYPGTNKSYTTVGLVNRIGVVTNIKTGYVNLSQNYSGILTLANIGSGNQWQVTMAAEDPSGAVFATWSGDLFVTAVD